MPRGGHVDCPEVCRSESEHYIYRINIFHNDEVNRNGAQLIFIFFFCPLLKYICR